MNPDPIAYLHDANPGTVIYGVAADAGEDVQIEILIRESDAELARLPNPPNLQMRAGVIQTKKLQIPVVLFRLGPDLPVYQSFWNYYHPREHGELSVMEHMTAEPHELIFKLVGDAGAVANLFSCYHPLATFFESCCRQAEAVPSWSEEEFYQALDEVDQRYPSPFDLWQAISDPGHQPQ